MLKLVQTVSFPARKCCADGPQTGPALQILWFKPLSLFESAIAALSAGAVNQLHSTAGAFPAQPLLFSENALSYVSLRRAQLDRNQTA
jgi:hypothetical protein